MAFGEAETSALIRVANQDIRDKQILDLANDSEKWKQEVANRVREGDPLHGNLNWERFIVIVLL